MGPATAKLQAVGERLSVSTELRHAFTADTLKVPDGALRLWRYGAAGGRPKLHFAHATGFHARTYAPLFARLAPHFEIIALDMRGHGESRDLGEKGLPEGWENYYADLKRLLEVEQPAFLAGHSFGATTSLIAASRQPAGVRGVLLLEPVLVSPRLSLASRILARFGLGPRPRIARAAAARRPGFASREEAFENYRGKRVFSTWTDEWLHAYVDDGFVDISGGVELACRPSFEATSFLATEFAPWVKLRCVNFPVSALAGELASTFPVASQRALTKRLPTARVDVLTGASHMLPMEHPDRVVEAATELLDTDRRHP